MHDFLRALLLHRSGLLVPASVVSDEIYQVSTIGALLEGDYEGAIEYRDIAKHGDFGLGTFNQLDGEMVALDGKFYQITDKSGLKEADMSNKAPFAVVKFFRPELKFDLEKSTDWSGLQDVIAQHVRNKNALCAIKVTGHFEAIKVRTVPKQEKPYRPMTDIAKSQPEFELSDQSGTLVGFRFPKYCAQLCVPGFHLHFVNEARNMGGHLLACSVKNATVELDYTTQLYLELPDDDWFATADLNKDRTDAVEQVEGSKAK